MALPFPRPLRLYTLTLHLTLGTSLWGHTIGVLSSLLIHPGWRAALGDPPPSTKGLITAAYYVGTLLSHLFVAHPLADRLGRRRAAVLGTAVLCSGAVLMACAGGAARTAVVVTAGGRVLCGLGGDVVSTAVALHQGEVSPASERGKLVTLNHVGFVAGMAAGLWTGYGMTFWTSDAGQRWGWRVSLLVQLVPAVIFIGGLPFLPDSPPRWLLQRGHPNQAAHVLHSLRDGNTPPDLVTAELAAMSAAASEFPAPGTLRLFRDPSLFARLWRAFLLQFMAQMCGAAAIKYHLPTLLRGLGLGYRLALMAGAVEMTVKIGMAVLEMWVIDWLGRRRCLLGGSVLMGVAMGMNGLLPLLYPRNKNPVADAACIAFIFVYAMGYSLGLGPAAWVYSSEIFPTPLRARGLNLATTGSSLGSMLASAIWPLGNQRLGTGVYFFFMLTNLPCLPIIHTFYPETKNRPLEDMDSLFGKPQTRTSASSPSVAQNGGHDAGAPSGQPSADERQPLLSSPHDDDAQPVRPWTNWT